MENIITFNKTCELVGRLYELQFGRKMRGDYAKEYVYRHEYEMNKPDKYLILCNEFLKYMGNTIEMIMIHNNIYSESFNSIKEIYEFLYPYMVDEVRNEQWVNGNDWSVKVMLFSPYTYNAHEKHKYMMTYYDI